MPDEDDIIEVVEDAIEAPKPKPKKRAPKKKVEITIEEEIAAAIAEEEPSETVEDAEIVEVPVEESKSEPDEVEAEVVLPTPEPERKVRPDSKPGPFQRNERNNAKSNQASPPTKSVNNPHNVVTVNGQPIQQGSAWTS